MARRQKLTGLVPIGMENHVVDVLIFDGLTGILRTSWTCWNTGRKTCGGGQLGRWVGRHFVLSCVFSIRVRVSFKLA
jgi:hypothetical protein